MSMNRLMKEFRFGFKELFFLSITSFSFGLIHTLRFFTGTINYNDFFLVLLRMFIISFLVLILHFTFEKVYAVLRGIKSEYKYNLYALIPGLYVGLLFFNQIYFLSPGYLNLEVLKNKRVGKFRYRTQFVEFSTMAIVGIVGTLVLASIINLFAGNSFYLNEFIVISLFVSVLSLIPIPLNDGFYIFTGSWYHYAFIISFVLSFILFFYLLNPLYLLIFSFVIGIIGFLYFFYNY